MTDIIIYRVSDGTILAQPRGGDADVQAMAAEEETAASARGETTAWITGHVDDPTAWRVVNGVLEAAPDVVDMPAERARALAYVMMRITEVRAPYIPPIPGQGAIYRQKQDEARLLREDLIAPRNEDYPFLASDALRGGITLQQAGEAVEFRAEVLTKVAERTEDMRIRAQDALRDATTRAAVAAALAAFDQAVADFLAILPPPTT